MLTLRLDTWSVFYTNQKTNDGIIGNFWCLLNFIYIYKILKQCKMKTWRPEGDAWGNFEPTLPSAGEVVSCTGLVYSRTKNRGSDSSARAGKAAGRSPTRLTFRPGLMPEFPGLHPRRIEWNNLLLEPGICFHEEAPHLVLIMGCRFLSLPFSFANWTGRWS